MRLLPPVVREDLAFVRRRIWPLSCVWLLAAAISWALPDDQFHASVIWGQLGFVVALLASPTTHDPPHAPWRTSGQGSATSRNAGPRRGMTIYATSYMVYLLTHVVRWGFFGW